MIKRIILTILSILLTVLLPVLIQRGWTDMLDWMPPLVARILTFVVGFTAIGLLVYAYWDKITERIPVIQFFKADNITTIRVVKMPRPESNGIGISMKYYPERYISPYILSVNASPMLNGQNYLHILCCFFNALPCHVTLMKPLTCFLIGIEDRITSKSHPLFEDSSSLRLDKIKPMVMQAEQPNEKVIRVYFNASMRGKIIGYTQQKKEIAVCLQVTGVDSKNKEYSLETPQRTTVFLSE